MAIYAWIERAGRNMLQYTAFHSLVAARAACQTAGPSPATREGGGRSRCLELLSPVDDVNISRIREFFTDFFEPIFGFNYLRIF